MLPITRAAASAAALTVSSMLRPLADASTVNCATGGLFQCPGRQITGNGTDSVSVLYGTGANTAMLTFTGLNASLESNGGFVTARFGAIRASDTGIGAIINDNQALRITQPAFTAFPIAHLSCLVSNGVSTSWANFQLEDPQVTLGSNTYELDTSRRAGRNHNIFAPAPEPMLLTVTSLG